MGSHYFDLDDILCSSRAISCAVDGRASSNPALIKLLSKDNGSSGVGSSSSSATVEVPLWLLEKLNSQGVPLLQATYPRAYRASYRQVLDADPTTVDLNKHGPYYYTFGLKLTEFRSGDERSLANCLREAYLGRVGGIVSRAQHGVDQQRPANLDKWESALYQLGADSETDLRDWRRNRNADGGNGERKRKSSSSANGHNAKRKRE